jgi:hypothetical protein
MRFNVYDNLKIFGGGSVAPQSFTGSSAVNGQPVDTQGAETAAIYGYATAATGSPSAATLAVALQESASGTGSWTAALDNTGTAIAFTLNALLAPTANTVSGSNQLSNFSSTTGLYVGQYVTGTGIPVNTVITSITLGATAATSTATMSANATASNTSTTLTVSAENLARIEGLNLNRKRFLRAVVTPAFTGGSTPAILGFAQIVLGNDQQLAVNTTTSNT